MNRIILALVMAALAGCAGTQAAYKAAESPDEYAFVLVEHYSVLVEQAAKLKESGVLPMSAVRAMQQADLKAAPVIEKLRGLSQAYKAVNSAENEAQLQAAINEAVKVVAELVRAVRAAGPAVSMVQPTLEWRLA